MQDNQNSAKTEDLNNLNSIGNSSSTISDLSTTQTVTNSSNDPNNLSEKIPELNSLDSNPNLTNLPSTESKPNLENIISPPVPDKKYESKKFIATIFGILILVSSVSIGVYLVQKQQDIRERAASGSTCDQSPDCELVDNAANKGSKTVERQIIYVDITDKEYHRYYPGDTDDGCRKVNITSNTISWEKYGEGSNCKDISNVQIWMSKEEPSNTPTPLPSITQSPTITQPPSISAKCSDLKVYSQNWNPLSQQELNKLTPGTKVIFAVSGTANSGIFDKARFSVNSKSLGETTLKKPVTEEFYIYYTIPENTVNFNVEAQIHHSELGWF